MPNSESEQLVTGILYCWGLPEVVVTALDHLARCVHWRAEAIVELPDILPEQILSGFCLRKEDAGKCRHLPPERILLLAGTVDFELAELPALRLPMRANLFQQALERIGMTSDIRGVGDLAGYSLRTMDKTLRLEGSESLITLTDREADIIRFLLHDGKSASRAEVLAEVWGYGSNIETQTLETHVSRLRVRLGTIGLELKSVDGHYNLFCIPDVKP